MRCERESCESDAIKKGLCQTHYLEVWYAGREEPCSEPECDRISWSKGMCLMHYKRQWRHGSTRVLRLSGKESPEERLRHHGWTVTDAGCWEWAGRVEAHGYGRVDLEGTSAAAHRLAYETWVGPITDGLFVCHACDNRRCINPEHLWLGTNKQNMEDMVSKGRVARNYGEKNNSSPLKDDDVRTIRARRASGELLREIATDYGVTESCISSIVRRKTWSHLSE